MRIRNNLQNGSNFLGITMNCIEDNRLI